MSDRIDPRKIKRIAHYEKDNHLPPLSGSFERDVTYARFMRYYLVRLDHDNTEPAARTITDAYELLDLFPFPFDGKMTTLGAITRPKETAI